MIGESKVRLLIVMSVAALLAGCATYISPLAEVAPKEAVCPSGVPAGVKCFRGRDSANSHYLIAVPQKWSGVLVVHAHGGPVLGDPPASRADEDIRRWAITLSEGHAWASSVFRQGGFAVTTAAEDTERIRQIFIHYIARPRVTLLHGQSWGTMVAARAAELYPNSWGGLLLTSSVIAGPTTYDFRLDLRAVYQHLCGNHPRPTEAQYPLSIGLPAGVKMSAQELASRADECLGIGKPATQRTAEQLKKIKTIVDVIRIPEASILGHLTWGTISLQDVVSKTGGASPFGNHSVRYQGSDDDNGLNAALNAKGLRFKADPMAARAFAADVDYAGRFRVPVLTTHGINDSTVFVEGNDTLRQRMERHGVGANLVQTFVDSREHSYLGDPIYPPLFEALLKWVEQGIKPTPLGIANRCKEMAMQQQINLCRFAPDYAPRPLASRIAPR